MLVDKIGSIKLSIVLKKSCQIGAIFYLLLGFVRTIVYLNVHKAVEQVDGRHSDKGIGSFLAEYVEDGTVSVLVTLFLAIIFLLFYLSNFCVIRQLNKLIDFLKTQNEDRAMQQAIPHNVDVEGSFI